LGKKTERESVSKDPNKGNREESSEREAIIKESLEWRIKTRLMRNALTREKIREVPSEG